MRVAVNIYRFPALLDLTRRHKDARVMSIFVEAAIDFYLQTPDAALKLKAVDALMGSSSTRTAPADNQTFTQHVQAVETGGGASVSKSILASVVNAAGKAEKETQKGEPEKKKGINIDEVWASN